jgi:transposase
MSFLRGTNRSQVQLLPPSIDDYVAPNAAVRFIDAYIEGLDLGSLGFTRAELKTMGRPAYHPRDLVKLYVYGYLQGIRSSRKLEAEATRNLEVIWLLGGLRPDFKTIADFRKDNRAAFQPLFRNFNLLCRRAGLFGAELMAIDGSRFKAVNSLDHNYSAKRLQELVAAVQARIEDYLFELEQADTPGEQELAGPSQQELEEKIARLKESKGQYEERLKQLEDHAEAEISVVDPDSRKMTGKQNTYLIGYNVQVAVDAKHHLIVAQEVVQQSNDRAQLAPMAMAAKEALQTEQIQVVADKGYHEANQLEACEKAGIQTYVLAQGTTSGQGKDGQQIFAKEQFRYDTAADVYHCPGGQTLRRSGVCLDKGKERIIYLNRPACAGCAIKGQCTSGSYRTIGRLTNEAVVERAALRMAQRPELMSKRKSVVEHVFGTLRNGGHDRFLMKHLEKVRAEFSLSALAYNLRRVLNLLSIPKLIETLKKWGAKRQNTQNDLPLVNIQAARRYQVLGSTLRSIPGDEVAFAT